MTKSEFCKKCKQARKHYEKGSTIQQQIYNELDDMGIAIDEIPSQAENADCVDDAISCYISYGEYTPEQIWDEIQNNLRRS